MTTFEAAVIGAGPAGLAAALSLAHVGVEVAVVAPPAPGSAASPTADRRTTALLAPSIRLLANLGAWEACAPSAAPIAAVRIADDRGGLIRAPEILFRASELGLDSFGANIANPILLGALRSAAERAPRIAWVPTAGVTGLAPGAAAVRLALAEGGFVEAALAVAADGRGSKAPDAAGIAVEAWDYPQAAVACSFGHSRPHAATVNELHRHSGPLTTVPLPGQRSGLVWVEEPAEARRPAVRSTPDGAPAGRAARGGAGHLAAPAEESRRRGEQNRA